MKSVLAATILTASLIASGPGFANAAGFAAVHRVPGAAQTSALRALDDPSLDGLRAGGIAGRAALGDDERDALRAAESASRDLESLRAGDLHLTNEELKVVLIVVLAVLLIAAI